VINYGFLNFLAEVAIILPAFLLSLSFHEFSHALVATWLGDDTPKKSGRLTLNPLAHVDFLGLFFLLIFRVGWAKPVPFDQRNFKYPKFYSILTGLAGPFSNFILAFVAFSIMKHLPSEFLPAYIVVTISQLLEMTAHLNIMLGIFNLMPVPPLDGSHIIMTFLVEKYPRVALWFYAYSIFIIFILISIPTVYNAFIQLIMFTESLIKMLVF
jgi:Zn-dependent protease